MGPMAERRDELAVLAFATPWLLVGPAEARAQISQVGALDPFSGNDIYGDVWGELNHAYIGTHRGTGMGIVDVSCPTAPFLVTTYDDGVPFKDVKVHDGIGYFAGEAGGGLHIVDLGDPATPALLAHVTAGRCRSGAREEPRGITDQLLRQGLVLGNYSLLDNRDR
jgi:hypothetical protein